MGKYDHFDYYVHELRDPRPRKRPVCAKAMQPARVTAMSRFFYPRGHKEEEVPT